MQVVTKAGLIAEVAEKFRAEYFVCGKGWKQYDWDTEATYEQLKVLPQNAAEEQVVSILNSSWTQNICNECKQDVGVTVKVGQDEDWGSCTAWICLKCLEKALVLGRTELKKGEANRKKKRTMGEYQKRKEKCLYEELKSVYPELAPPDERTSEEKKRDAEQDKTDLFGPEENGEE